MAARPHRRGGHDRARELFGPLDGAHVPGGCDHCDAYQTVRPIIAGIWNIKIHHDDWCPWYRLRERAAS
jgi:hypothetical protein